MKSVKGFLRSGEVAGFNIGDLLKKPTKKSRARTQKPKVTAEVFDSNAVPEE